MRLVLDTVFADSIEFQLPVDLARRCLATTASMPAPRPRTLSYRPTVTATSCAHSLELIVTCGIFPH